MRDEIRLEGADLDIGENMRTECPSCGQRTLSISRDDEGLLYQCFRDSCELPAGRASGRSLIRVRRKPTTVHPYEGELYELDEGTANLLREYVGFDSDHLLVARPRIAEYGRVAFPIFGPLGTRRGWVLRGYDGQQPKALTRMDVEEPHTSWYSASGWERSDTVWLVEDLPSAVRAARYVDCIALLGTSLPDAAVAEITAHYRKVVWALDADATTTAIKNCRKYAIYFDESRVEVLERDFKDEKEERLCEILSQPPYLRLS